MEKLNEGLTEYVVSICNDCYEFKGEMCHQPGCIFIRQTMDEVKEHLNMMLIRPKVDGEYLRLGSTLEQVIALEIEYGSRGLLKVIDDKVAAETARCIRILRSYKNNGKDLPESPSDFNDCIEAAISEIRGAK